MLRFIFEPSSESRISASLVLARTLNAASDLAEIVGEQLRAACDVTRLLHGNYVACEIDEKMKEERYLFKRKS